MKINHNYEKNDEKKQQKTDEERFPPFLSASKSMPTIITQENFS